MAMDPGARHRDHRHERKVDDHDFGWPDARRRPGHTTLVGGNIGVPLSAQVDASTPETIHVVETSSFPARGDDRRSVRGSRCGSTLPTITWIDIRASNRMPPPRRASLPTRPQDDWAVVNADDPTVMAHSRGVAARKERFSLSGRISDGVRRGRGLDRQTDGTTRESDSFPLAAVELTGRHMLHNVLAATAVATLAGCPLRRQWPKALQRVPRSRAHDGAGR